MSKSIELTICAVQSRKARGQYTLEKSSGGKREKAVVRKKAHEIIKDYIGSAGGRKRSQQQMKAQKQKEP